MSWREDFAEIRLNYHSRERYEYEPEGEALLILAEALIDQFESEGYNVSAVVEGKWAEAKKRAGVADFAKEKARNG